MDRVSTPIQRESGDGDLLLIKRGIINIALVKYHTVAFRN
jgi:hypothetical protein